MSAQAAQQSPKTLSIGVLLIPIYQWLDAAGPVDYLTNHTRTVFELAGAPQSLKDKAFDIKWHYLSSTGTLDPVQATSGPLGIPSTTFKDCPPLDYLFVPGPDPFMKLPQECIDFVKARFAKIKGLLTVCTGSLVLAQTGVLDGYKVASNKVALKAGAEKGLLRKEVEWVGDRRFLVDGKVWSAAGVASGIDLGGEFARVHFDPEVNKFAQEISEATLNPAYPDPFAYILKGIKLD